MIKLLLLYELSNTTTEVNLSGLASCYDDGKHDVRVRKAQTVTADDLNWCDACLANRPSSIYMVRIGQALKKSGRVFMVFYDDDLLSLPKGNSGRWKKSYVIRCLHIADVTITCNPLLKSEYEKISPNSNFVNLHTHICEEEIKPIAKCGEQIKIVYAAGADHTEIFDRLIKPTLDDLADTYKKRIKMTLIGIHPDLSALKHREWIQRISTMPYEEYKVYMKSHNFDIGLAPLFDTPFSNKKYFNKFFEYSKNGITGLYSNHLPYTLVIKNKKNGVLVENTTEDWYKAICYAIDNIEQMKENAQVAQEQMRKEFSIDAIRSEVHTAIDPIIESRKVKRKINYSHNWLKEVLFVSRCKYHQFTAHLYRDGLEKTIQTVVERIKKYID